MEISSLSQLSASSVKTNIFNERFLYNINRDSFTKVSAKAIFDGEFKEKIFAEDSLYIIIGTDSGLLAKYVQEEGVPSGSRYLFIELEKVVEQLHQHDLLGSLDDEIIYSTYEHWQDMANSLKLKEYNSLGNVKLIKSISAQQTTIAEYSELNWHITEELQSLHFQHTMSLGSQPFLTRQITNIADNIFPAKLLSNVYQDQTAIVLAGGPSLKQMLPWVKQNRSNLVVFSVSRLSKLLISNDIKPDFVVSVDPQVENMDVSKEMFKFNKAIFVHAYHIDSTMVNQWPGIKLYLGNKFPWETELNADNIESVGSTVSNTALAAAHAFGCKRILLAGVDLCFSKEGITHTAGTDEAKIGPDYNNASSLELETYNGDKRTSDPDFYLSLRSLDHQAKKIKAENKQIINLAVGAAKAENIQHIAPEDIVFDTQDFDPVSIALQQLPSLTAELQSQYLQSSLTELNKAIYQIERIEKLAKKALKINNEMYSEEGLIENYKDKRDLDQIEKRLNKQYRPYSSLIKQFGVRNFIRITSPHDHSDTWDAEKAKQVGHIYYESYTSGSKLLLTLLNESIQRISARLDELKPSPANLPLLIEQWKMDNSYNRASMWKKNHPYTRLSKEIMVEFETMESTFQKILSSTNTKFKENIEKKSSLHLLKTKAISLFHHQKKDNLINLQNGLDLHYAEESEKKPYKLLLAAYIAELNKDPELALEHYDSLINLDQSPLLEESLQRIASLSIADSNHSNALLALKCLSQLSPLYLPSYAESSRITGDVMEAIDSYHYYIEFFPEDIVCKLKLVNLYIEIKVYDAAELMLDHILTTDPDMDTAIQLKAQLDKLRNKDLAAV